MKFFKTLYFAFHDLWTLKFKPVNEPEYSYAFILHMREIDDLYRKFPLFKALPKSWATQLTKLLWPVTVSKITGLSTKGSNEAVPGWFIAIPLTAEQMLSDKKLALRKILEASRLARNKGARMVGLGAMTASLSRGGLDITERIDVGVTTGHAYTVHNVTTTLLSAAAKTDRDICSSEVAVVGASGSIGSNSARILARKSCTKLLLIDLPRKNENLVSLKDELQKAYPGIDVRTSNDVADVKTAEFIVTATSAPEALVRSEYIQPGTIIVDDAQPSDIDRPVFDREDVIVLEAGAVRTPGIKTNFYIDLKHPEDNFSCLAELLILASELRSEDYSVGHITTEEIDEVAQRGAELGFRIADFQNHVEQIDPSKFEKIKQYQ